VRRSRQRPFVREVYILQSPRKPVWFWCLRIGAALLACLVVLFVDATGVTYVVVPIIGDSMDWKSHYLAGMHSISCGRVGIRGDASNATQCALQADAKGQPFRVAYQIQGFDSIVAGGIVRTPDGKLLSLSFDGCPSGCGFSLLHQTVSVASCPQPYHLCVNPKGRINCYQPQLSYPANIMSPNAEPY
jgi:hypothetical protein